MADNVDNVTISNAELVEATAKTTGQTPEQVGTTVNAYGTEMINSISEILKENQEKGKNVTVIAVTPISAIEVKVDMKKGTAEMGCHPRVELSMKINEITSECKKTATAKKVA